MWQQERWKKEIMSIIRSCMNFALAILKSKKLTKK